MDHNVLITRVSSAMQRWLVIRSDDMSSCSCMQLVSHMFAPRLRWPRDRDPDECNLQARFATCSLARISSLASPAQQHCDAFVARQIANNAGAMPLCSASWGTRARTSLIAICMCLAFFDVPTHRELQQQRLAIGLREKASLPNVDVI